MLEFFQWIRILIEILPWLVMCASAIAAITPTPVDDGSLKKAYSILDAIALNIGKAKDK